MTVGIMEGITDTLPDAADTVHEYVYNIRINYKSGAYTQAWFKKFELKYNTLGAVVKIEWELPEVHGEADEQLTMPIYAGLDGIESVWQMSKMSAVKFYSKTQEV